jgi:hypothetical protein
MESPILPHHHKLEGKLQRIFEIPKNVISVLHQDLHQLYTTSSYKNPVTPEKIHKIVLNLFVHHYYPIVSRSIHTDSKTQPVIMGGVAFNLNVPSRMDRFLEIPTDDIDIKVYTTEINYLDKKPAKVARVLSIFRFMVAIICMYMKQIANEITKYTSMPIYSHTDSKLRHTKKVGGASISHSHTKHQQSKSKTKFLSKHHQSKSKKLAKNYIPARQLAFGIAKIVRPFMVLKKKPSGKDAIKTATISESIDISAMSYEDAYKLVMEKIDDPDYLITNKMLYNVKYSKPVTMSPARMKITFSDSKIIYPNIDYPAFYAYYFMNRGNNPRVLNIPLERLIKQDIKINDILETKPCRNHCAFISVNSLLIDICLMLSYAELLVDEDPAVGKLLVPIGSIFKYYKYITKFIKLHIIRKFYNGTLTVKFINPAKELIRYIKANLEKETKEYPENLPINLLFKKLISQFHQDFFMNRTLINTNNKFAELVEIANNYEKNVKYINKSRAKFKALDDEKGSVNDTIESISIQAANKMSMKSAVDMEGGAKAKNKITIYSEQDEDSLDEYRIMSMSKEDIKKEIIKMLDNEISFIDKVSRL